VAGAAAAAAHTGAVAGDQRVFRALVEESGAAWAEDVHDLLELAKTLAVPDAGSGGGLAILTCSGGDSALAADECARMGLSLPPLGEDAAARLRELLPDAATVGNPLDYTALIWGDVELLRDIVVTVGADSAVDRILIFYDQAADAGRGGSWAAVREGIRAGAAACQVPVMVSSTLPELLDEHAAGAFIDAGVPAVAGLRTGLRCAAALVAPRADPARLREIGTTARSARAAAPPGAAASPALNGRRWLSEHEAKELLRADALPVVDGRLVSSEDDTVVALSELGGHVAVKLSAPSMHHKADVGALVLGVRTEEDARAAHRRLAALGIEDARVLVERMADPGAELLVSARTNAVVPCLVVAAGGIWTEALRDTAVVPLPAAPERVEWAIRGLRAAAIFTGARGIPALDVTAAAQLAAAAGELLLRHGLELLELNPVLVHEHGAIAVDALAVAPAAAA
jgi:acetyl-CoA synthetase